MQPNMQPTMLENPMVLGDYYDDFTPVADMEKEGEQSDDGAGD